MRIKIDPNELTENVFDLIGQQWMLVTAGDKSGCNTLTASWGGVGVLWGGPVATIYIRPQRYTREFIEREKVFTLSFFGERYRKELALCGGKSGREINKVKETGFTVEYADCGAPYFAEADLVLVCEKQYADVMRPDCFLDEGAREKWYPQEDYHHIYIGKILEVLRKDS